MQGGAPQSTGDTYGPRQGCCAVTHSVPFAYNTTGIGSGLFTGITIKASSYEPVQAEFSHQSVTAFNATTSNIFSIGNSSTATEYLSTTFTGTTHLGYFPASNAVTKVRLTADTPIYIKYAQTGTAATAGAGVLFIREFKENTQIIPGT